MDVLFIIKHCNLISIYIAIVYCCWGLNRSLDSITMDARTKGKERYMALKLDKSKAHDRVE